MKPDRSSRRRPERQRFDPNLAGMFRATREGKILEANESFARTLGHAAPTELRGRHLREFYVRSEEHTSELQSLAYLVCRLLLEKKKKKKTHIWNKKMDKRTRSTVRQDHQSCLLQILVATRASISVIKSTVQRQSRRRMSVCTRMS